MSGQPGKGRAPKDLLVALDEARIETRFEALRGLKDHTKRLALYGREIDGAMELVYMRGFQVGYEQALKDGKRASKAHALDPERAEADFRRVRWRA